MTRILCALFATLALWLGGPAAAQQNEALSWERIVAPNAVFAADVPCDQETLEEIFDLPMDIQGMNFEPENRIFCVDDGLVFAAGLLVVPQEHLGGGTLFDLILSALEEKISEGVALDRVEMNGRRALVSRQVEGETTAQSGMIEVAENQLLMLLAGGPFGGEFPPAEVPALIDRYFSSIEVLN